MINLSERLENCWPKM